MPGPRYSAGYGPPPKTKGLSQTPDSSNYMPPLKPKAPKASKPKKMSNKAAAAAAAVAYNDIKNMVANQAQPTANLTSQGKQSVFTAQAIKNHPNLPASQLAALVNEALGITDTRAPATSAKPKTKPIGSTSRSAGFAPTPPASGTTTSGRTNSTVVPHTNETNQQQKTKATGRGGGGVGGVVGGVVGGGTYTPPSIPTGTFSSMSPQQIDAWIQTHVNADINPSISEIRGEQTRANDLANHQATSYAGFVNAAAQLQQGIGTNVANIYGDAASRQSTFAKGFSDAFQHLESQEQGKADQLLSQNGAPAAQISQVNSQLGGGADALYALGTEPAKGLNEEGAAFGAAASFLPYATQGQGLAQLASMTDAAKQTNAGFGDQIAKLEAERPGTIQKYLDFVQQQRSSEAQTRYQAQTAAQSEADRQTQLGLERQSLGLKTQAQNFSQGVTKAKLQQEADRIGISLKNLNLRAAQAKLNQANAFAKIYGFDPATGRLTLSAQQAIKKANKQPKLTAYQAQKYKGQAMLAADRAKNGFTDDNNVQHPAIDFGDAFRRGLGTVPLNILVPALFYYYKPGERPDMTADQFLKQLRGK